MIRCIPLGICAWNFRLDGEGHRGFLKLTIAGEQGSVSVDDVQFDVRKHGIFSGRWTLNYQGEEVALAQKSSPLTRTFELQTPDGTLQLFASSPLGRSFQLHRGDALLADIYPDHPATRRARIDLKVGQWDAPIVFFAFWLVALMWHRAAQSG